MKKIVFLIILLAIAMPSFASDWVKLDEKNYIDKNNIEQYKTGYNIIKSEQYSFWIKSLNDKSARFNDLEKSLKKKIWYNMENYVVDCNNKSIATNQIITYGLQNEVLDQYEAPYLNYTKVVPDSNGELWYYILCKPQQIIKKYAED